MKFTPNLAFNCPQDTFTPGCILSNLPKDPELRTNSRRYQPTITYLLLGLR